MKVAANQKITLDSTYCYNLGLIPLERGSYFENTYVDVSVTAVEAMRRSHFRADHELFSENVPIFEFTV